MPSLGGIRTRTVPAEGFLRALEPEAAGEGGAITLEVRLDLPPKTPVEVRVGAL